MANEKMNEIKALFLKKVNKTELNDEFSLKDLGLDSLDVVEMCLDLEDAYDIRFSTDELRSIVTVGDLMKLIENKIN